MESADRIKAYFDKISPFFDGWIKILQEKIYDYVTLKNLKQYLPEDKNSLILDAGGGTGRWSIPLAMAGYKIVLCDISEGMLNKAKENILRENLSDKVFLIAENLISLSFNDEIFDFIICEDGPISISDSQAVLKELYRVLKPTGKIWACVLGRYSLGLRRIEKNISEALNLLNNDLDYIKYKGLEKNRVFDPDELKELMQYTGFKVINLYGNRIITPLVKEIDDALYDELKDIELKLSREQSILGSGEYLQIVAGK